MAEDESAGGDESGPVSFLSRRTVDPRSLPGGRSERRLAARGGRRRRRLFTQEEKRALLGELASSGERVAVFGARVGVHPSVLHHWRRTQGSPKAAARGLAVAHRIFSPDERRAAVEAHAKSGLTLRIFAQHWGVSVESLRHWIKLYRAGGPKALEGKQLGRPPGTKRSHLPPAVQAEIVRTKRRFPGFGLKKVRDFLMRFQGTRVSTSGVRRVLEVEGLRGREGTRRAKKKRHPPRRFERAKPGELWQTDITSFVLTRSGVRVYLVVFLDDFSRYVVTWKLSTRQKSELVTEALLEGIERFGKPQEVLSDQGRQYFTWRGKSEFQKLLARQGIAHVVARTHHPQTLGKCERLWETIGTELWER